MPNSLPHGGARLVKAQKSAAGDQQIVAVGANE